MSKSRFLDYTDADSNLLYWIERVDLENGSKKCISWRPDGNGGRIKGLDGIEHVLYKLPATIEAVKQGETIFICEGEKNTDHLTRLELSATTNSHGAGGWQDGFSDYLKGADVVVLEDNDQAGRNRTEKVTHSLLGKARTIKVLRFTDLPEHGDVSDWITGGHTKEELLQMVAEAPEWKPKGLFDPLVVRLSDVQSEEVSWLWEPYIPLGKLTLLEGDPQAGKTWVALAIAAAITTGRGCGQ